MANKHNGTIYTGATSNLSQRAWEDREGMIAEFKTRCGCKLPVWYEFHETTPSAIGGEKEIKAESRKK